MFTSCLHESTLSWFIELMWHLVTMTSSSKSRTRVGRKQARSLAEEMNKAACHMAKRAALAHCWQTRRRRLHSGVTQGIKELCVCFTLFERFYFKLLKKANYSINVLDASICSPPQYEVETRLQRHLCSPLFDQTSRSKQNNPATDLQIILWPIRADRAPTIFKMSHSPARTLTGEASYRWLSRSLWWFSYCHRMEELGFEPPVFWLVADLLHLYNITNNKTLS